MVNVLHASPDAFDMLLYPQQSYVNTYIQNQFSTFTQTLNEHASRFIEESKRLYDALYHSKAMERARNLIRSAKQFLHPTIIRPLETLEELQQANVTMQRWVMAQPEIRSLYKAEKIQGYPETYVDVHPNEGVGHEHYDYRRVMSGIVEDTEDGWHCRIHVEDLLPGDRELDFLEKCDILSTWDILEWYLTNSHLDPTDPFGGERA